MILTPRSSAIAFRKHSTLTEPDCLTDIDTTRPTPGPHDLLVAVRAVSVNPVDTKIRAGLVGVPDGVTSLGWDAAGIVEAVGDAVTLFQPGDAVYYADTFDRSGSNAQFHLVDARIAGRMPPKSVSIHWEMVFTRPLYGTPDMIAQHHILNEVAALTDAGVLRSTATRVLHPLDAARLMEAHRLVENGGITGKVVVARTEADTVLPTQKAKQ